MLPQTSGSSTVATRLGRHYHYEMGARRFVEGCLPYQIRRFIVRRRFPSRRLRIDDLRRHPAGERIVVETYWLESGDDGGPALSVRVLGEEVWRIDLLAERPHLHFNISDNRATRSPHPTRLVLADDAVGPALDLLRSNFAFPLSSNRRRALRRVRPDPDAYLPAIDAAEEHLASLVERYPRS